MRVLPLVVLSSCFALAISGLVEADQLTATRHRPDAPEIGVNHPDLAELLQRLAGQSIQIRTLPSSEGAEEALGASGRNYYEQLNRNSIGMREVSLLLVDCSCHRVCDDVWLERLGNHGVSIIKLRHSTVPSAVKYSPTHLRQICSALSEAIPGWDESLQENLARELNKLNQSSGRTHKSDVVLSGS